MSDSATKTDPLKVAKLIGDFADFVKVSSLYPNNNERVQRTVREVLAQAAALRGTQPRLQIRMMRHRFAVGFVASTCDKPNVEWLAKCMADTALGGLAIEESATAESLLIFSARLRRNAGGKRSANVFEAHWSEPIPGIVLLERLFGADSELWDQLSVETRRQLEDESPRGDILRQLIEGDDGVLDALGEMFASRDHYEGNEFVDSIELVRQVAELLPDHVIGDPETCVNILQTLAKTGSEAVAEAEHLPEDRAKLEYRRLLLEISGRFFTPEDGKVAEVEPPAAADDAAEAKPQGHAGDEKFTDDLDEFFEEYRTLPDGVIALDRETADAPVEKLGIALHRFQRCKTEVESETLEPELTMLLQQSATKAPDLVRLYLQEICAPEAGDEPWARVRNMAGPLERTRLIQYMIDFRIMTPRLAAATFPRTFGAFIDALDDSPADRRALAKVCDLVGPAKLLAARDQLLGRTGALTTTRRRALLATRSRHALPFALLALESDDATTRREVLDYLIALKPHNAESVALRMIDDVGLLPRGYLTNLCLFEMQLDEPGTDLRAEAESLLRSYLDHPPRNLDISRRIRAIGALRAFWSDETEKFARSLLRGTGFLGLRRQPKEIRAAVKTLLRTVAK